MLEKSYTNFNERRENIAELTVFATQFKDLGEFLEKVSLVQAHDLVTSNKGYETSKEGEVVSLMTIHLAKGLEFDRVFLAGASEGILPHHRSIDTLEKLEEERRLTYVALTRARKKIHISFYDIPSRFLSELPIEVLDYAALDGKNFEDEERYITLD